jgi:hypothetical protein
MIDPGPRVMERLRLEETLHERKLRHTQQRGR